MSGALSWILGRPKDTQLAGFKVQTSVYGAPIPIVYGTTRIPGNLIHMPAEPVQVSDNGGKSSKGANSGQLFQAPVIFALCEGEVSDIGFYWRDKDAKVLFGGGADPITGFQTGTASQAPWAFLTSDYPAEAIGYQSTAYMYEENAPLPNDSMPQYSWEVTALLPFNVGGGIVDASPAAIIPDLVTNTRYGLGLDVSALGSLTSFVDYCAAAGVFISPAIDNQKPVADWFNEFTEVGNSALVWSDGVLKIIPYGDVSLTGNGHTYTPNTTPLYDLTDTNFLAPKGTDPITVTRKDPSTAYNQIVVRFRDRDFDYNESTVTVQDQHAIELYGVIPMSPLVLLSITTVDVATTVAQLRLQREQNIRNQYGFRLGWRFSLLEPMDLVTLTDAGLGLSLTPVRLTSIVESADEQGFDCVAEDWPFGTASATLYASQAASGTTTNANVDPGNTTTPIIFEGPTPLQSAPLEIWIGASGGDDWGGCDVYISVDNTSFEKVGTIRGKAIFGLLTATLVTNAAYPSIDTTHTLAVNLTSSGGAMVAQSNTNFLNLTPLCYLGGREFVAYRDLSLVSAYNYDLTHLYRGLYSSTVASHTSGTAFVFCDTNILQIPWPLGYIGQVLYFKFPAFNIYGGGLQDLASVSSVSHTVGEDPVIPGSSGGISQGTISISTAGLWTATIDGIESTLSFKYLTSTSVFPSDASVLASGTVANGRTVSVAGGSLLTNGQTLFLTAIPYDAAGGTGTAGPSIHLRATYAASLAIPQGTVAIDQDGYWNATADGPTGTNSFRWLASTSSYPADATVIASGTVVGSSSTFSVINQGPLNFGETIYITIVAFTDTAGLVAPGSAIHLRGAYQSYSATKTAAYSPSGFVVVPDASTVIGFSQGTDGALWCAALTTPTGITSLWMFPVVPNNVEITQVDFEFYNNSVDSNKPAGGFERIESNAMTLLYGSPNTTAGLGWQVQGSALAESTTGRSYMAYVVFQTGTTSVSAGEERMGNIYITYTAAEPDNTL